MQRVAVIGAGLAGVTVARNLATRATVEVFEKSRGTSGRLATRRVEGFQFDHGAQSFTARDERFRLFLRPFLASGLVQEWTPRQLTLSRSDKPYKRDWFEPHYVAVPTMTALVKELAASLAVQVQCTIQEVRPEGSNWLLLDHQGKLHGPFDWVVSTCPAEQTRALFPASFQEDLTRVTLQACFCLMLGFEHRPKTQWEAAVFKDSCLSWAIWNNSKPGRSPQPALVVLSDNDWADQHFDLPPEEVKMALGNELAELTGLRPSSAIVTQLHRWRYANASVPAGESFLLDSEAKLAACGDWCLANRVEAAFLSGARMADRLFQLIHRQ